MSITKGQKVCRCNLEFLGLREPLILVSPEARATGLCHQAWLTLYTYIFYCVLGLGVYVKNMQDCCIGTYMAMLFAAFLPITYI